VIFLKKCPNSLLKRFILQIIVKIQINLFKIFLKYKKAVFKIKDKFNRHIVDVTWSTAKNHIKKIKTLTKLQLC